MAKDMNHARLQFARLKTPVKSGELLIEPSGDGLLAMAESNRALLRSYSFAVLDLNVSDVRAEFRRTMCDGCDEPAVITGHQPEFIHAGVWAKHVVAARLAEVLGGKAINLVVDNDAPKQGGLEVVTCVDGGVGAETVACGALEPGRAYESIRPLDDRACEALASRVRRLMGERFERTCMSDFLSGLRGGVGTGDWVDQMVFARREVEGRFGVAMIEHRVSRVWAGPMLGDLICNAERFAACYNEALARYRAEHRVRGVNRPIPDLMRGAGRCEVPVWVYRLGGPRRRLFVERAGDTVRLFAGTEGMSPAGSPATPIAEMAAGELETWESAERALMGRTEFVIRPRALSLTLWARVLVGDLFIHGIGGAKYDRITDDIIRRYYGVEPPGMGCVSATLRACDAPHEIDEDTLRAARRRVRDMRFNPQRYVGNGGETADMVARRERAVAESRRLAKESAHDRSGRREVFERIRRISEALLEGNRDVLRRSEDAAFETERKLADIERARRRDYFFAMMDRVSLERLRDTLVSAVTVGAVGVGEQGRAAVRRKS